jgi:predicted MFS family arabinose efflux permease
MAQVLLAYHLTHSVFTVGVVTCAQFSGSLLLGPWAAVLASRVGGKRMLIGTQVLSGVLAGGLAGLERARLLDAHLLIVGALALGLVFTFALPVQTALVPRLVDDDDAEAALTMNSVSYNTGRAIGPALAVGLIIATGFTWAFALNAISFAIYAVALMGVRLHEKEEPSEIARATDGLATSLLKPRILLLLAMVAAVTFADDPVLVLGPAVARHVTGTSGDWAGYFVSFLGIGTVLGSFRESKRVKQRGPSTSSRRAALSLLVLAIAIVFFAAGIDRWVSLAAAFVAGAAALRTGATTQAQLVRQGPKYTASVMALWAIAWAGTKPLASFSDGWLASHAGVRWAGFILTIPAIGLALGELLLPKRWKSGIKSAARTSGRRLQERLYRSRQKASAPTTELATAPSDVGFASALTMSE